MAGTAGPTPGAGYISNPKKRKAIEEHAEQLATAHYEGQGWTVEKLGKPYDLHCTRGTDERHVEVKGTTGAATSVELTNEVLHAPGQGQHRRPLRRQRHQGRHLHRPLHPQRRHGLALPRLGAGRGRPPPPQVRVPPPRSHRLSPGVSGRVSGIGWVSAGWDAGCLAMGMVVVRSAVMR
ncbi:protein NO VEIN domain-containing protein [Streptomyces sp. enrichment culture]|uniref:protein NO VEIN domain-containing protein n=1 Tax=Streptomyces sp. enrichment culture TaxID=1795815 RepID=UPI003F5752E0